MLRDHLGQWISGFSLHVGLASNNMAELAAIKQGLAMAWNIGVKFLQLELDSKVVLTWLTNNNMSYPTNIMPLICNCRNLLDQEWKVHMQHVHHEAMVVLMLWQSRGLANGIWCLCIVTVPVLLM